MFGWLLFLLVSAVTGKFVVTSIMLSETTNWRYLTKFAMDIGTGSYSIRARFWKPVGALNETRSLSIPIYQDTRWDEALNQETCDAKRRAAKFDIPIKIPTNGDWSELVQGSLRQNVRAYFWYFALADCRGELHDSYRIRVEANITNSDESQFSLEDKNMEYVYLVFWIGFMVTLSSSILKLLRRFQKTDSLEPPLFMLNLSVSSEISALTFEALHLWLYSYDGSGLAVFDFFHQCSELVSTLVITVLFLLISSGWTLRYSEFPDMEVCLPVSFLVVVLHLLIAGLGRLTDDSYSKYTDYEGIAGFLLLLMRLAMCGWFAYNMSDLYRTSQGTEKTMIWNLSLVACLYFLALPAIVIVSWFIAPYVRKKVVVIGSLTVQMVAFLLLSRLLSEKSAYYKMSTLSDSVLPGSKLR